MNCWRVERKYEAHLTNSFPKFVDWLNEEL